MTTTDYDPPASFAKTEKTSLHGTESHGIQQEDFYDDSQGAFKDYARVFWYTDVLGWSCRIVAFTCAIASGVALPLVEIVFGKFVSNFNEFANHNISGDEYEVQVRKYTMYFVYLFIGRFMLVYVWSTLISISAVRTTKALRVEFIRQSLRQEISYFDLPGNSLSAKVTTNGNHINNGIAEKLGLVIQGISTLISAFIVAFVSQWKLTLILIGVVPANLFLTGVAVAVDAGYEAQIMSIFSEGLSLAEETFSTIRTAHALWAHPILIEKFRNILVRTADVARKKHPAQAILFSVEFLLILGSYGLAFWQGIHRYHSGEFELGKVVTVIFAVVIAAQSLTQLAPQIIVLSKSIAAASDIFRVIDRKSAIDSLSTEGLRPALINGRLDFQNVFFSYPSRPNSPVLRGFTLEVPAGKTTALVGASGSGKSTIVGLVERWYAGYEGSITLDGVPIENLNLGWLRSNIRLVQQEPTLFSGTIFENVVYGLVSTPMASVSLQEQIKLVENACKAAFAHEFICKLPQGYDTTLGEKGATLSGGQKQRIVIARSIISDPRILILDEATSALDPTAEKIVQQALNNVAVGRTLIIIAHRLSTIKDADNIVVMSKGQILEQGTHDALIKSEGAYSLLVNAQNLGLTDKKPENKDRLDSSEELIVESQLLRRSTSNTRMIKPNAKVLSQLGLLQVVWRILKDQRQLRTELLLTTLICIVVGLTYPVLAIIFGKVMEALTLPADRVLHQTDFYALMFFVVALVNFVLWALAGWLTSLIGQTILRNYRQEVFENIVQQDMAYFDCPENQTGALVSRLSTEPTNLLELMSINLGIVIYNISNITSSTILALVVGWKLGLVLLFGALLPLTLSGLLKMKLEFLLEDKMASRFASSSGLAAEAIMAIRTVSSMTLEKDFLRRYECQLHDITRTSCKELFWIMPWYALSQSMTFEAMALGFWYGGRLVATGEYTTTKFYIVFLSILFSGEAAGAVFSFGSNMTKAEISGNYIFGLRTRLQDLQMEDCKRHDDAIGGDGASLGFHRVQFAYPQRPSLSVLKGIDLTIQSGKFVAFVGPSGCGKTTMISLLEQFYQPTAGKITFNGEDISDFSLQQYRAGIAIVQQEPVLYQGTIRENITLGLETRGFTDEDVELACKQANIFDFITSLADGLSTPCGYAGLSLSGGQRQRIAIARALIRTPRLLLLDEATSALDTESEKVVKEALDAAAEGRTTVAVAHRLSTIKDADIIVVFSDGNIVESGCHDELVRKQGVYYDMCVAQSLDQGV